MMAQLAARPLLLGDGSGHSRSEAQQVPGRGPLELMF